MFGYINFIYRILIVFLDIGRPVAKLVSSQEKTENKTKTPYTCLVQYFSKWRSQSSSDERQNPQWSCRIQIMLSHCTVCSRYSNEITETLSHNKGRCHLISLFTRWISMAANNWRQRFQLLACYWTATHSIPVSRH
jgi:hypothetical protein